MHFAVAVEGRHEEVTRWTAEARSGDRGLVERHESRPLPRLEGGTVDAPRRLAARRLLGVVRAAENGETESAPVRSDGHPAVAVLPVGGRAPRRGVVDLPGLPVVAGVGDDQLRARRCALTALALGCLTLE